MRAALFLLICGGVLLAFEGACFVMNDRHLPVDAGKRPRDAARDGGGDDDDDDGSAQPPPTPDGGCDPFAPFTDFLAGPFARIDTTDDEAFARVTDDELSVYYGRADLDGGSFVLRASRPSLDGFFDDAKVLIGADNVCCASVTSDEKRLFYVISAATNDPNGLYSIVTADRPDKLAPFTNARVILRANETENFTTPKTVDEPNGRRLYFTRYDKTLQEGRIHSVLVDDVGSPIGSAIPVGVDFAGALNGDPTPSADGLALYFYSDIVDPERGDIYVSRRDSLASAFGPPSLLVEFPKGPSGWNSPGHISKDSCRLYYYWADTPDGPTNMWVAYRKR